MAIRSYFAEWILPIVDPPIHQGYITLDDGKIAEIGPQSSFMGDRRSVTDLGHAVITPALVNAIFHPDYPVADPHLTPKGNFFSWLYSGEYHTRGSSKLEVESDLLLETYRAFPGDTHADLRRFAAEYKRPYNREVVFRFIVPVHTEHYRLCGWQHWSWLGKFEAFFDMFGHSDSPGT